MTTLEMSDNIVYDWGTIVKRILPLGERNPGGTHAKEKSGSENR